VVRNSHRLSSLPTYNTNLTTSGTFFPCWCSNFFRDIS
jgi:hypothetical protein